MRADDEDCSTSSATGSSCASWSMTLCRRAHSGRWRRVEAVAQAKIITEVLNRAQVQRNGARVGSCGICVDGGGAIPMEFYTGTKVRVLSLAP